ncbi:hypothetical protein TNCT_461551 [Trichonephila clavata]|uniref:Uncharacterized protein n=1 Tax=Trichonephila clavata TaxID=2740835 RepID=A0A8X6IS13_TRICU|nr:hypothetical protein TNCT_461551 [Trichonephila clavata]
MRRLSEKFVPRLLKGDEKICSEIQRENRANFPHYLRSEYKVQSDQNIFKRIVIANASWCYWTNERLDGGEYVRLVNCEPSEKRSANFKN